MRRRNRSGNSSTLTQNDFDRIQRSMDNGYSIGEAITHVHPSSGGECSLTDMLKIAQRRSIGSGRRRR